MKNNDKKPRVSVIMPVYNSEKFLRTAIDSILNQTFTDFELIILHDPSTDRSWEIITSYTDPRIRPVNNESRLGISGTLNKGIELAQGVYIARMDGDDVSLPNRLMEQVAFMDSHCEIGISGSWVKVIGDKTEYVWEYYTDPDKVKASILFVASLAHPTVIMRKSLLDTYNLRYEDFHGSAEDYELWSRASECFRMANMGKVLLNYRVSGDNTSSVFLDKVMQASQKVRERLIKKLGIEPTKDEMNTHQFAARYDAPKGIPFMRVVEQWFQKLLSANAEKNIYKQSALQSILGHYWYGFAIRNIAEKGIWTLFWKSPLLPFVTGHQKIKFVIKYILHYVR